MKSRHLKQKPHSLSEIFRRADEQSHHPLHWPWEHWFTQSSRKQQSLWIGYRVRNRLAKPFAKPARFLTSRIKKLRFRLRPDGSHVGLRSRVRSRK